jgi:hypothetical protein
MPQSDAGDLRHLLRRISRDRFCDLTAEPPGRIVELLALLTGTGGYVLHGSNHPAPLHRLVPMQATDFCKTAGSQCAVYASIDWIEVLIHALLNTGWLRDRFGSVTYLYRRNGQRYDFRIDGEPGNMLQRRDPALWSSGFVYVLDRAGFARAEGSDTEFFSLYPQVPRTCFRVSAGLSGYILPSPGDALRAQA